MMVSAIVGMVNFEGWRCSKEGRAVGFIEDGTAFVVRNGAVAVAAVINRKIFISDMLHLTQELYKS